jgi:hypothetical protein
MSVPQRTSTVLRRGAFGLLVGGVILVMVLVAARQDHPGDGRCAELWNAPANQANRSVVGGHAYPLVTVRGAEPNKAGQPGCLVLLRQRADGPWMLFAAVITETAVIWDGGVTGVRYGTDSPTGDVNDTPNAMLQPDGNLASVISVLLCSCSGVLTTPPTVAPSTEGLPTRQVVPLHGRHPTVNLVTSLTGSEQGRPRRPRSPPGRRSVRWFGPSLAASRD